MSGAAGGEPSAYLDFPELQGILVECPHLATKSPIGRIVSGHVVPDGTISLEQLPTRAPESRASLADVMSMRGRFTNGLPGLLARSRASPDAFADGHLAALDRQVGLSDEQKPQVRAVFLEEGKNLFAVFGDATLSDAQKQARIQQIHVVTEHKVWGLLTHEQRKMMTQQPVPRQVT